MKQAVEWVMWSPRRFLTVTCSLLMVAVIGCTIGVWGGVVRMGGSARSSAIDSVPGSSSPSGVPSETPPLSRTRPAPAPTSTLPGQAGAVAAALALLPTKPTGTAFVESGDETEAVVRVPIAGGLLDVAVEHDSSGWTATSYAKAR